MNQQALAKFLSEKFDVSVNQPGLHGIKICDNLYKNVVLELHDFTLGDYQIKHFFEAIEKGYCSGFFFTPRGERESDARHYILFH